MPDLLASLIPLAQPPLAAGIPNTGRSPTQTGDAFAALFQTAVALLGGSIPAGEPLAPADTLIGGFTNDTDNPEDAATDPTTGEAFAGVLLGVPTTLPAVAPTTPETADAAARGVASVTGSARPPAGADGEAPSRTQQLRFRFPGGPTQALRLTGGPFGTVPNANASATAELATTTTVPAPERPVAQAAPPTQQPAGRPPVIPAQAPIVSGLNPLPQGDVGAGLEGPGVSPVSALIAPATAPVVADLPSADRPAVAGDRFAAIASAGARLVTSGQSPIPFATTLDTQTAQAVPANPTGTATAATVAARSLPQPVRTDSPVFPAGGVVVERVAVVPQPPVDVAARTAPASTSAQPAVVAPAQPGVPAVPTTPATASSPTSPFAVSVGDRVAGPQTPAPFTPAPAPQSPDATTTARPVPVANARTTVPPESLVVFPPNAPADVPRATPLPADRPVETPDGLSGFSVPQAPPPDAPRAAPAAPAAPTAAPPTPATQIADGITARASEHRDGTVEFRMRLDPAELGHVRVALFSTGDDVRGQIVVADDVVRRMVESQLPELRQRLEDAGLNVQRFDVTTDPGTGGNRSAYRDAFPPEGGPPPRPVPAAPRPPAVRPAGGGLDVMV